MVFMENCEAVSSIFQCIYGVNLSFETQLITVFKEWYCSNVSLLVNFGLQETVTWKSNGTVVEHVAMIKTYTSGWALQGRPFEYSVGMFCMQYYTLTSYDWRCIMDGIVWATTWVWCMVNLFAWFYRYELNGTTKNATSRMKEMEWIAISEAAELLGTWIMCCCIVGLWQPSCKVSGYWLCLLECIGF